VILSVKNKSVFGGLKIMLYLCGVKDKPLKNINFMEYTAIIEKVSDDCYIASCAEIKGANTQGATIEEVTQNLAEAIRLVLETEKTLAIQQSRKSSRNTFFRKIAAAL
jgi:predicted RNase H-like HicB family nuclease